MTHCRYRSQGSWTSIARSAAVSATGTQASSKLATAEKIEPVLASDGTDLIFSAVGDDLLDGKSGDDEIFACDGVRDVVFGGPGTNDSLAETFDVGQDTGTQVDPAYVGSPFPVKGALDRVAITLTDNGAPVPRDHLDWRNTVCRGGWRLSRPPGSTPLR